MHDGTTLSETQGHNPQSGSLLDEYMTPAELADELGVCERTIARWHALREGPPRVKMGKRILYHRQAVQNWLKGKEEEAA